MEDLTPPPGSDRDLRRLGALLGDRRIVLLGENGHGVGEFSALKARLAQYLHEHHGFTVVAFESGFHECREADRDLGRKEVRRSLTDCLIWQLHHGEIEPLFEHALRSRATRPLHLAGIDLQIQGRSSRTRPRLFRDVLGAIAPDLADTIAVLDSILIERSSQAADSVRRFVREHGMFLRTAYDSGARITGGDTSWTFRSAAELMRRELHRVAALSFGLEPPSDVYAIRDLWMAETIRRLAGGDSGTTKVIVWLHNDHARYGQWQAGPLRVRAAGGLLRDWLGEEVFSVGFLMGAGTFADNFRRERRVPTIPEGSLEAVLGQAGFRVALLPVGEGADAEVREWADRSHPYLRGDRVARMRPGREFDALVWFDTVSVASYLRR